MTFKERFIMGIDPGMHGGVAALDEEGAICLLEPIPEDRGLYLRLIQEWAPSVKICYMEQLHGMPNSMRGGIASFKLGRSYGEALMALEATHILYDLVDPRVWQTKMKCLTGGNKAVSLKRAKQLYPGHEESIAKATSDALLIAAYGWNLIRNAAEQKAKRLK